MIGRCRRGEFGPGDVGPDAVMQAWKEQGGPSPALAWRVLCRRGEKRAGLIWFGVVRNSRRGLLRRAGDRRGRIWQACSGTFWTVRRGRCGQVWPATASPGRRAAAWPASNRHERGEAGLVWTASNGRVGSAGAFRAASSEMFRYGWRVGAGRTWRG